MGSPRPFDRARSLLDPALSVVDQALAALAGLLATLYVGRFCGPRDLGLFAVSYILITALASLQNGLVLQGLAVFGAQKSPSERPPYYAFVFWFDRGCLLGVYSVVAIAGVVLVQLGLVTDEAFTILLAALFYSFGSTTQNFFRRLLYLESLPQLALLQSAAFTTLAVAGLVALHALGADRVSAVYLVLGLSGLLAPLVQVSRWYRSIGSVPWSDVTTFAARHWRFGRWILLATPFVLGTYQAYYFFVALLLSSKDAGLLKAADSIVLPFEQIAVALTLFYTPRLAERFRLVTARDQRLMIRRLVELLLPIALAYALAIFLLGGRVLVLAYGPNMAGSVRILPIVALLPLLHALAYPANIAIMVLERPQINLYSRLASTAVTLTLGIYLVSHFGLAGAAVGLAMSVGIFAAGLWFGLIRCLRASAECVGSDVVGRPDIAPSADRF